MKGTHASRLGPTRAEVLDRLRKLGTSAPLDEIADAVGIHQNTARFHLDALVAAGLVVRDTEHRDAPGRPKVLYRIAPASRDTTFENFAEVMVRHFAGRLEDRAERSVDAGLAWGESLRTELVQLAPDQAPLDRLLQGMTSLGYEPELVLEPAPVLNLRPCPYATIASQDPDVVCQIHLGLMRGILGPDQPWDAVTVQPWVTPNVCRVLLAAHPDASVPSVGDAADA